MRLAPWALSFRTAMGLQSEHLPELARRTSEDLHFAVLQQGRHNSMGSIERYHQPSFSQYEQIRLALAERMGMDPRNMQVESPISPWNITQFAWLVNPFLVHEDGRTSNQKRYPTKGNPGLTEFGGAVHFNAHGT